MKVWTKVQLKDQDPEISIISKSLSNYIYKNGPITDLIRKYNISANDKKILDEYTTNRIAGLLMLYIANDQNRINNILNKYNNPEDNKNVVPELEGYIEK